MVLGLTTLAGLAAGPRRFDPITRGWLLTAGGGVARLALGFGASVLVARALGPATFGRYAVLGVVAAVAGAALDFGLTDSAIKRVAAAWATDPLAAARGGRVFFWLRLTLAAASLLIVLPLAAWLLGVAGLAGWRAPTLWTLLGVGATALCASASALLQATGRFGGAALVGLANAGLTLILASALFLTGRLTLLSAIVVLGVGTALAAFLVGWRLLPRGLLGAPPRGAAGRREATALLRFGRWLWPANVLTMLTAQLDVLLVQHWGAGAAVGVYALALALASKADVLNQSLYTVLLPAAAALRGPGAVCAYLRQGFRRGAVASAALLLVALPLAGPSIPAIYGAAYAPAVPLFRLLLGVVVFDLLTTPLLTLPYHFDRPALLAAADALRAATFLLAGALLIPRFGLPGAVAARACCRLVGAALIAVALARRPSAASERPVALL